MPGRAKAGTAEVDAYLAALAGEQRAALQALRETIRSAAPDATETISYRIPTFELDGGLLVSYAAFKDHCSLFPASGRVMEEHGRLLEPFFSGKGTLRFTVDRPIPAPLVRKIVRTRVAELSVKG